MMIAAVACICACDKPEAPVETFETNIQKLYGNYQLSDIHWPGLPVDLNDDEYAYWDLLHEFKNKAGYYEPDYVALPYPKYEVSEGKWKCTEISTIKISIRATEDTFMLQENSCWTIPGYNASDNPFLYNIVDFSLFVDSFDDNSFKIGVHCLLPYDDANGNQTLNGNYLYYTFTRK